VLQEEFSDVEWGVIILTFRITARDIDEIHKCVSSPMRLGTFRDDFNKIRNHTSAIHQFRDLLSASPSSTAPIEGMASILPLSDDMGSRL
jgi:hypothetical protein